ncbi:MAG: hypothetical protein EPO31_12775 [Gammaproteobacteria bacterium]|nr:MAG: hypothetical protein EPO31_12775 [Gammaproteobacteria bacterium]
MRRLFVIVLICLQLQSCETQSVRPRSGAGTDGISRAAELARAGDYRQAAEQYRELARLYPDRSTDFQMRAAESWYLAGDLESAATAAATISTATKDASIPTRLRILEARIDVGRQDAETALRRLGTLRLENIPADFLDDYFETRAAAFENMRNPASASRERVALDRYLQTPSARETNNRKIWDDLKQLNNDGLQRLRASSTDILRGWVELALIEQSLLLNPNALTTAIRLWNQQYANHPAAPLSARLLDDTRNLTFAPSRIALLLPFDGQYGQAAQAIRDGFLAAWYTAKDYRPFLRIYSANALNITESYKQAVTEGAEYIVGPLEREAVGRLLATPDLPVKVLALNHFGAGEPNISTTADPTGIPKIVQFGLLPEDEAREVARQAALDGHHNALIISQNEDYDRRIHAAFQQEWTALGGRILARAFFDETTSDFSTPVRELLNVGSNERRATALQRRLNRPLRTETRLRDDADMIFLVARPEAARQIVPQLRFYRADRFTVYASSRVHSGTFNPQLDRDLDNIKFPDSPWVLTRNRIPSEMQQSINRNWLAQQSPYNRFYAFGIDAFGLIPHLGRLARNTNMYYRGESGDLFLDGAGVISRKLTWAKFKDGMAASAGPKESQ